MLEDFELRIRIKVDPSSYEAEVIKYLNSKDTLFPKSDMVMIALVSYWLPFAYQKKFQVLSAECKQRIRSCIYRLKLHQRHCQDVLAEGSVFEEDLAEEDLNEAKEFKVSGKKQLEQPKKQSDLRSSVQDSDWFNPLR